MNPSDYIGFAEYLGLNDEAGKQMLAKTMQPGMALRNEATAATDARFQAAKNGSEAYAQSGERERKGLASYGEFMKGLQDPGARMALMEKVYGRGSVSALDSALTGASGAEAIDAGVKDAGRIQRRAEEAGMRNDERAAQYEKQRTGYEQQDAAEKARRQANYDQQQAMLKKRAVDDENRRVDSWASSSSGYYGNAYRPDQEVGGDWFGANPFDPNPRETAREKERRGLAARERETGKKWKAGASGTNSGGGGW